MKKRNRYVFGAALASVAFGGVPGLIHQASAAPMTAADFTFESIPTSPSSTAQSGANSTGVSFAAEIGTGTAYGFHSAGAVFTSATAGSTITVTGLPTSTVYSEPGGNGSKLSLSSQNWAPGDYYLFAVPTTTINGVMVSFDQVSSATGPGVFSLLYSVDGTNFSTFTTYTIPTTPNSGFSSGTSTPNLTFAFDLSGITGLNADPSALFEVVDASSAAYNSTGPFSSGSDRIDNVIVSGTAAGVPEPASLTLLSMAAAAVLLRRRPTERA